MDAVSLALSFDSQLAKDVFEIHPNIAREYATIEKFIAWEPCLDQATVMGPQEDTMLCQYLFPHQGWIAARSQTG